MGKPDRVQKHKEGRATQKRRSITEESLIKAAVTQFSKYGYDGSTTKDIAETAGVNESLIIRYFGGKEGLLLESIRRFIEAKRSAQLPYEAKNSLVEELVWNTKTLLSEMQTDMAFYKILFGRSSLDSKVRRKISDLLPKTGDPRLLERIDNLRKGGGISKGISNELLLMIPFQAFSAMFLATTALNFKKEVIAEDLEILVRATIEGLIRIKSSEC